MKCAWCGGEIEGDSHTNPVTKEVLHHRDSGDCLSQYLNHRGLQPLVESEVAISIPDIKEDE